MGRPIYRDIRPQYKDTLMRGKNANRYDAVTTIRLDTITRIENISGSEYARLTFDDDTDCYVTTEEANAIRAELKKNGESLAQEVSALTHAVRDLWQLLRARM